MAEKHISLPKPYSGGDFSEWIQRFEICCDANGWDADRQLKKLPTLLEGEALAVWLEAADDERGSYDIIKKLIVTLNPDSFVALDEFHKRRLRPDETPMLYVFRLKMLQKMGIEGIRWYYINSLLDYQRIYQGNFEHWAKLLILKKLLRKVVF